MEKIDIGLDIDRLNIKTPKGGKPTWVFLMSYQDMIIGSVTFYSQESFDEFKSNYKKLPIENWGSLIMHIDLMPEENKS